MRRVAVFAVTGLVLELIVLVALVVALEPLRGCGSSQVPPRAEPDFDAATQHLDDELDAAVRAHEVRVDAIERETVERRLEHARIRVAEETAVRGQGRDALAAWLSDFLVTLGDAGVTDAGVP